MDDKAARQDDRSLGQPRNSLLSSRRIRAWSIPVDLDSYLFLERLRQTVRHMRYLFRRHVLFSHRDTPPSFFKVYLFGLRRIDSKTPVSQPTGKRALF